MSDTRLCSTSSWLCFCQGQHLHSTYDLYLTMLHDTNLTSLQCRLLLATTQQINTGYYGTGPVTLKSFNVYLLQLTAAAHSPDLCPDQPITNTYTTLSSLLGLLVAYFSSFLVCALVFLWGFAAGSGKAVLASAFFGALAAGLGGVGLGAAALAGAGAGLAFLPSCSSGALAFLFFSCMAEGL